MGFQCPTMTHGIDLRRCPHLGSQISKKLVRAQNILKNRSKLVKMALKISDTPNFRSQILNKNNIEIMFKMVSNVSHIVMNRKIKDLSPYYKEL